MKNKELLSEEFALKILKLEEFLNPDKKINVIAFQILKSGTSIGASIAEAKYAESEADFIHKLSIAQKEGNETKYWLRLLFKTGKISEAYYKELYNDCNQIIGILGSIIVKMKNKDT